MKTQVTEAHGLRGHSIGELYPVIRVVYGDDSHGIILGSYELGGLSKDDAREISQELRRMIDLVGFGNTLDYFRGVLLAGRMKN